MNAVPAETPTDIIPSQRKSASPKAQRKEITPRSIEGGLRCNSRRCYNHTRVVPWASAEVSFSSANVLALSPSPGPWPGTTRTRVSPSRFRFRPPLPPTLGFRLRSPGVTSTYSRSVLGAGGTLGARPGPFKTPLPRFVCNLRKVQFSTFPQQTLQLVEKRAVSLPGAGSKRFAPRRCRCGLVPPPTPLPPAVPARGGWEGVPGLATSNLT